VCLTAEATAEEHAAAIAAGAAELVEKGRPVDELVAAIRRAVENAEP
jgi:DNA-binding NarL/FixJ family response regulator